MRCIWWPWRRIWALTGPSNAIVDTTFGNSQLILFCHGGSEGLLAVEKHLGQAAAKGKQDSGNVELIHSMFAG